MKAKTLVAFSNYVNGEPAFLFFYHSMTNPVVIPSDELPSVVIDQILRGNTYFHATIERKNDSIRAVDWEYVDKPIFIVHEYYRDADDPTELIGVFSTFDKALAATTLTLDKFRAYSTGYLVCTSDDSLLWDAVSIYMSSLDVVQNPPAYVSEEEGEEQ